MRFLNFPKSLLIASNNGVDIESETKLCEGLIKEGKAILENVDNKVCIKIPAIQKVVDDFTSDWTMF